MPVALVVQVALRTTMLDHAVRLFVARHRDAVVVDLGAGLDSRRPRVAPPPDVDWFDVDLPAVAALRDRLLPPAARSHTVGVSVTDPAWTTSIPRDRPTILVADGLLPFLTERQVVALLHRVADHFTHGELAFNDYGQVDGGPWAMRFAGATTLSISPLLAFPGFGDPAQVEVWEPRLRLVAEDSLSDARSGAVPAGAAAADPLVGAQRDAGANGADPALPLPAGGGGMSGSAPNSPTHSG